MHFCRSPQLQLFGRVTTMLFLHLFFTCSGTSCIQHHPMSPDRFPVHMSTSIFERPLQDLSPKDSILTISGYNEGKQLSAQNTHVCTASVLRFHLVQVKKEATRPETQAAWRRWCKQLAFLLAAAILLPPICCSLICGERPGR